MVDFACMAARVVIEVDGSQHGIPSNAEADLARTRWLEGEGYRVLRFWNNDISGNMPAVLDVIYAVLYETRDAETVAWKHKRHRRQD